MKLLLDENLSRRIIPYIEKHYPGSTQVTLIGLERALDYDVWKYARNNDFVIVTRDSDFYDLSSIKGAPPSVIWLKTKNSSNQEIAKLLIGNKEKIYDLLKQQGQWLVHF
jgi:predicted nuclease of predicted toxin-antitoxin system